MRYSLRIMHGHGFEPLSTQFTSQLHLENILTMTKIAINFPKAPAVLWFRVIFKDRALKPFVQIRDYNSDMNITWRDRLIDVLHVYSELCWWRSEMSAFLWHETLRVPITTRQHNLECWQVVMDIPNATAGLYLIITSWSSATLLAPSNYW